MKSISVRLGLAVFALVMISSATPQAFADSLPSTVEDGDSNTVDNGRGLALIGVNVTVKNKAGNVVARTQTDAKGEIRISSIPPGEYEIDIDGTSLVAAMDKLAPPAKKSGSSFGLSVGGMFGGGSSRSSSGHEGATNGHPESGHGDSHSSSGGVGVGLSVPIGGDNKSDQPGYPITNINILLPGNPNASVSFEAPYCRDAASRGMRIEFTVPDGNTAEQGIRRTGFPVGVPVSIALGLTFNGDLH